MTARDAISLTSKPTGGADSRFTVDAGMHLLDVLPRLFESPSRELRVVEGEHEIGLIDSESMLEAMAREISPRADSSVIVVECAPVDFSASIIARAVEDTDTHLVDMLTAPGTDGHLRVTLRIRCEDPEAAVHSLERYGYTVTDTFGHDAVPTAAWERLLGLQTLINV